MLYLLIKLLDKQGSTSVAGSVGALGQSKHSIALLGESRLLRGEKPVERLDGGATVRVKRNLVC